MGGSEGCRGRAPRRRAYARGGPSLSEALLLCLPAQAEAARAEEKRKEEEAKRKAEESRKAEEKRKAEETKRQAEAAKKAEEERQRAEAEARRIAEEEAKRKAEAEAQKHEEEEARRRLEAESRRKAEEESQKAEAEEREAAQLSQTEVPKSAEDGQAQVQAEDGEDLRTETSCEPGQAQADELERLAEEARQRAAKLRRADEAPPDSPGNEPESGRDTGDAVARVEEGEAVQSQKEEESHVRDAAKPVSPDSAEDLQVKESNLKEESNSNFFHEEHHCFDVAHQVPLWELPSKESRLVGAASKGAQLLGAVQESTGGQQWLHVSSRSCHAMGALADSAWALIHELNLVPAVERQPQALGYAGRYEVAHGKVAVRASPSLKGKIIGVVHEGRILMGTPHKVGGYAWLRFEESSRKKLADIGEEAWALIDGEPLGLQELLRPLDNDGRKTLESFHAKQQPEEASIAALAGPTEEKTDGPSEGHEAKDSKKDSKKEPDAKHDAKEATTTAISDPAKVESRMKAAQQARDVLSGPIEYKVLAQDHAAPVRREPLVQSPEVGKLERGHPGSKGLGEPLCRASPSIASSVAKYGRLARIFAWLTLLRSSNSS